MIDENSTKEEVLEAVKQCGDVLRYASEELRFEMLGCWVNAIEQGLIN